MKINGVIISTFNKNGSQGYRIRGEKGEENWYVLDEKIKSSYNPNLRNKSVVFEFFEEVKGKSKRNILTSISEEGIKEIQINPEEHSTLGGVQKPKGDLDESSKREIAISFADRRFQSLDLALKLYPEIKSFRELVDKSRDIEEYIKTGNLGGY